MVTDGKVAAQLQVERTDLDLLQGAVVAGIGQALRRDHAQVRATCERDEVTWRAAARPA